MVPGDTLSGKAAVLSSWGIGAISVFWPYDRWDAATREELLTLEDRLGVTPCEFALVGPMYGRLMDPDPAHRADCRAMYLEAADVCAELGIVTELEFEYRAQDPMPLFDPYQRPGPEQSRSFVGVYREICDSIADSDAEILLEPLNRYESRYLNSVEDCVDLLDEVDRPVAGLLFDFFHAAMEEADLVAAIKLAGSRIRHVHLADNNRLLPGRGSIDWPRCIDALREVGFDGYLSLECSTSGDPSRTVPAAADLLNDLVLADSDASQLRM
jgi:sugar phosphate isomerase/epimerase